MPWNNESGGKSGGKSGGPWGSGGNGSGGKSGGPWGAGPTGPGKGGPPNFEDMIRQGQDRVKRFWPGGFGNARGVMLIGLVAVALWLLTGFFRVQPNEVGVKLVFGQMTDVSPQGLHWNWPAPIGEVERPDVTKERTVEVGFVSGPAGRTTVSRGVPQESLMLTGDENIIDVRVVVFWKVDTRQAPKPADDSGVALQPGIKNFLFNIRNPERTVKDAAESVLREVVGKNEFEFARTQGRVQIEVETGKLIQIVLDQYGAGIQVLRVKLQKIDPPGKVLDAFRDVQAARADKESVINEANAYFNQVVQRAEGDAEKIVKNAEGYREERIAVASGEASRFLAVYKQYLKEKGVTRRRIYVDTMQRIMRNMDKVLIDNRRGSTGVVPYLPLRELDQRRGATTSSRPGEAK